MTRQTRATLRRIMARPLARDAAGLVVSVCLAALPYGAWLLST
jgi:hypothetical protein